MMALTGFKLVPAAGAPPFDAEAQGRVCVCWPGEANDLDLVGAVPIGFHGPKLRLRLLWQAFGGQAGAVCWQAAILRVGRQAELSFQAAAPSSVIAREMGEASIELDPGELLVPGDHFDLVVRRNGLDPADTLKAAAALHVNLLDLVELPEGAA